jgi:hypothetical protein
MAGTSLDKPGHDGGAAGVTCFIHKGRPKAGAELAMTVEAALSDG